MTKNNQIKCRSRRQPTNKQQEYSKSSPRDRNLNASTLGIHTHPTQTKSTLHRSIIMKHQLSGCYSSFSGPLPPRDPCVCGGNSINSWTTNISTTNTLQYCCCCSVQVPRSLMWPTISSFPASPTIGMCINLSPAATVMIPVPLFSSSIY